MGIIALLKRHKKRLGIVGNPKLIRESRWIRVYQGGPKLQIYDSKFASDHIELKASEFREIWKKAAPGEKLEFCSAYIAKPEISSEDEKILNLIMKRGNEIVWRNIVGMLPRHPNRKRVLTFLIDRIEKQPPPLANFYKAIETLNDKKAVRYLEKKYAQYAAEFDGDTKIQDRDRAIDYMQCCKALWKLSGSERYEGPIRRFLHSGNQDLRNWAQRLLSQRTGDTEES